MKFYESYKNDYLKEKKDNNLLKTQVLKNKDINQTEKIIRDKLNLTRPDETSIIVNLPTPTPLIPTPTPQPNWEQWIKVFIK